MNAQRVGLRPIPSSYQSGIDYIESMTWNEMANWLFSELHEREHKLAGGPDDFPVQAIVNHYSYLSFKAQNRMDQAIDGLIYYWKQNPEKWTESAVRALLSLAGEFPVPEAVRKLKSLVESGDLSKPGAFSMSPVLRAIASLSTNDDLQFWNKVADEHPKYAGMAFQVLTRIGPRDALALLERFPNNEDAIGSVARVLPRFVSEQPADAKRIDFMRHLYQAIDCLPTTSAQILRTTLDEARF